MSSNSDLTCTEFLERLPLYVGGDLEEEVQSQTTSHLASCEACSEAWRGAVASREALLSLRGDVTGEGVDLWSGIRTALREAEIETTRPAAGRLLTGPWQKAVTAAAAAVVLGFLWIQRPGESLPPAGVSNDAPAVVETSIEPSAATNLASTKLVDTIPGFVEAKPELGRLRKREAGEERMSDGSPYFTYPDAVRFGQGTSVVTPVSASRTSSARPNQR